MSTKLNADQQDATLRLLRNLIDKQSDLLIGSEMSVFNSLIKLRLSSRKEVGEVIHNRIS